MKKPITILIAAPREQIFDLLVEPAAQKQWIEGLVEAQYQGTAPKGRGTKFRHGIREGSRLVVQNGEIRVFTPPIHFAYRIRQEQFDMDIDILLTETDAGTLVAYRPQLIPRTRFARVLGFLFSALPFPARVARQHLAKLKVLAETL